MLNISSMQSLYVLQLQEVDRSMNANCFFFISNIITDQRCIQIFYRKVHSSFKCIKITMVHSYFHNRTILFRVQNISSYLPRLLNVLVSYRPTQNLFFVLL